MRALNIDNEIALQLSYFVTSVKAFNAMDRTDINRVAQNILVPIFAETYGFCDLRNLDIGGGGNFPGIDLADDTARVAIQVTSTSGLEKVKHTLEQFLQDRAEFDPPLAKRYDRVIVYVLTERQKTYSQTSIDSILAGRFQFDTSKDVWDFQTLMADIQGLPLSSKEAILNILESQINVTLSQLARTGLIEVPEGKRSGYFVGRTDLLEMVHASLTAADAPPRFVAITGMGGIGKTQAALEYIRKYQGSYNRILWTSGESEVTFLDGLKAITDALLPAVKHANVASAGGVALSAWMAAEDNKDWLLVIDGADFRETWTPARLKSVLPVTRRGRVLITSQYREFAAFPGIVVLPVGVLPPDDAVALLVSLSAREPESRSERGDVHELAELLGRLPIALEQAAAYVRTTGVSFDHYKGLLQSYGLGLLPSDFDHAADYPHSVQTVFLIGFERVRRKSPQAILVLELAAFLAADFNCLLPITLLAAHADGPLSSSLADSPDRALLTASVLALVGVLSKYSLISVDHAAATVSVHRVVQMAVRENMSVDLRKERLEFWASAFGYYLRDPKNSSTWGFIRQWFPHALSVAKFVVSERLSTESAAVFLERVGAFLESQAHYEESRSFALRAVEIREASAGAANENGRTALAHSLTKLGLAHHGCNDIDKAIAATERALGIYRSAQSQDYSATAVAMANLGGFFLRKGNSEEAELLFLKILDDPKLRPALRSDGLSTALHGMASLFNSRKEYEKAASFALEAVTALEGDAEIDPLRLANAYSNLGALSAKCGRLDDAETIYQKAINLFRNILPDSHPYVANLETNLGYLFFRRGLYAKALPLLLVAVPKLAKSFGDEHPTTIQAARNYLQCVEELEKEKIAVVFLDDLKEGEPPVVPKGKVGMILVARMPDTGR